jgi:hypothetical protein
MFKLLEVLVKSQVGYGARQFNGKLRRRALQIAVCGGNVVRVGDTRFVDWPLPSMSKAVPG